LCLRNRDRTLQNVLPGLCVDDVEDRQRKEWKPAPRTFPTLDLQRIGMIKMKDYT